MNSVLKRLEQLHALIEPSSSLINSTLDTGEIIGVQLQQLIPLMPLQQTDLIEKQ